MALTFFAAKGTCSNATHIALEEAGAKYELRKVDLAAGEQRKPEYLKINPKGRVPALITDNGILTENVALLQWIAQAYPQAKLAPLDNPFKLAQMNSFNAYLSSTVHVAHAHKLRGARWTDDAAAIETMKAKVPQNMKDCFTIIENDYLQGPWVLGDQYSVADAYLFTIGSWLEGDGVDPTQFPKFMAHRKAMMERPAVQKVLAA